MDYGEIWRLFIILIASSENYNEKRYRYSDIPIIPNINTTILKFQQINPIWFFN